MNEHPLFVYGTLMSTGAQRGLLADLPRVAAWVNGQLWSLPAGYPALVPGHEGVVHGELVAPPDAGRLSVLDAYEGVSEGLYARVLLSVRAGTATRLAWAWVMANPEKRGGRLIASGRWKPFVNR